MKEIKLDESNFEKDYRKILAIPEDASAEKIANTCAAAFQYVKDPLILEAANILNNPESRRQYDNGRQKMFLRQQAEIDRKNKEADAEKIAEEKRNKAKRDAKRKEERGKKKAERELERTKKRINKKTKKYIKKAEEEIDKNAESREKVVYTYTDEETTNKAKNAIKNIFKKYRISSVIVIVAIGATCVAWNGKDIIEKIKTTFNKNDDNDINYNVALAAAGASLEEQEVGIQANGETANVESQELVEIQAMTFTDAYNDEQIQARANAINNYFKSNNYYKISDEELEQQIKYINGSYNATTDPYDIQSDILSIFEAFAVTITQNDNYISGVSENSNNIGLGLDAFLVDNSPNKEIVIKVFDKFKNLLTAKTAQEKVNSANEFLSLEYELMNGLIQNSNGENIDFESLSSSEGFIIGTMFQLELGNTICQSILEENGEIQYINIKGEQIAINYEDLQAYYDPQHNDEFDYENIWVKYCLDLVKNAEAQKLNNIIN